MRYFFSCRTQSRWASTVLRIWWSWYSPGRSHLMTWQTRATKEKTVNFADKVTILCNNQGVHINRRGRKRSWRMSGVRKHISPNCFDGWVGRDACVSISRYLRFKSPSSWMFLFVFVLPCCYKLITFTALLTFPLRKSIRWQVGKAHYHLSWPRGSFLLRLRTTARLTWRLGKLYYDHQTIRETGS